MLKPEPSNYFEYIIRDAESYGMVLAAANLEISQLEPGCLSGRHVRLALPGGEFSYVETSLAMRGIGTFPNLWTLSVVLESTSRSRQHGIRVRPGSLVIHQPNAEHDGVYSRNFKVACFTVRDDFLESHVRHLDPEVQFAMRQPWSVFEPPANLRQKIIERFAQAAAIVQSDPRVRDSPQALANFETELVWEFLEAVEHQFPVHSTGPDERAAKMVRQIDQEMMNSLKVGASVTELCAACEVPRRTLNRAFQNALGMGPATYLRRLRLNHAHRAFHRENDRSTTVTDVALELGFWHLGRFAEQYTELFGEAPHDTLRRSQEPAQSPESSSVA
jgi:AraC family ethanolamine operon transcriptional activator